MTGLKLQRDVFRKQTNFTDTDADSLDSKVFQAAEIEFDDGVGLLV